MAISRHNSVNASTSSSSSLTATLTASVGEIVVVLVSSEQTTGPVKTVSSISDGVGNTYAMRWADTMSSDPFFGAAVGFEVWWAYVANALVAATITVTMSAEIDDAVVVAAGYQGFTGTAYQAAPWDTDASLPVHGSTTAQSQPTFSGLSTASTAGMLLFGYGSVDTSNMAAAPTGWALVEQGINNGAANSQSGTLYELSYSSARSALSATTQPNEPHGWLAWADALNSPSGGGGGGVVGKVYQSRQAIQRASYW